MTRPNSSSSPDTGSAAAEANVEPVVCVHLAVVDFEAEVGRVEAEIRDEGGGRQGTAAYKFR